MHLIKSYNIIDMLLYVCKYVYVIHLMLCGNSSDRQQSDPGTMEYFTILVTQIQLFVKQHVSYHKGKGHKRSNEEEYEERGGNSEGSATTSTGKRTKLLQASSQEIMHETTVDSPGNNPVSLDTTAVDSPENSPGNSPVSMDTTAVDLSGNNPVSLDTLMVAGETKMVVVSCEGEGGGTTVEGNSNSVNEDHTISTEQHLTLDVEVTTGNNPVSLDMETEQNQQGSPLEPPPIPNPNPVTLLTSSTEDASTTNTNTSSSGTVLFPQINEEILFSSEVASVAYTVGCAPSALQEHILAPIDHMLALLTAMAEEGQNALAILGSFSKLQWMANTVWNIALILMSQATQQHTHGQQFIKTTMETTTGNTSFCLHDVHVAGSTTTDTDTKEALATSAMFFEKAQQVYAAMSSLTSTTRTSSDDQQDATNNQIMCWLLAASTRVDIHTHYNHTDTSNSNSKPSEDNMQIALSNVHKCTKCIRSDSGFSCNNKLSHSLKSLALTIELTIHCCIGHTHLCSFVTDQELAFLELLPSELLHCADICQKGSFGNVEVTRILLNYSLQSCMREQFPQYLLIGEVYRRLISLSTSRQNVSTSHTYTMLLM